jgi:uncharacterized membrane protein SpoIIM required for sporulation
MRLAVVEVGQIFEVIWVSLAAGVGITIAYSMVVLGTGRSAEARRSGRGGAAVVFGAMAVLFLAIFLGMIVLGVQIMLSKDA